MTPAATPDRVRVCIVGAGFGGIGLGMQLLRRGIRDFVILEAADEVGGTWRDNTYPGAACDVPSHLYSFSFAPNPGWTRDYSAQPEILDYLRDCVATSGLRPYIRFMTPMHEARWDDEAQHWVVRTATGELHADVLVPATGILREPSLPHLPGLETFTGHRFHSARWDHGHDLSGERVAVIGTGASAIQFVPRIQPVAGAVHVFQRTPPWVIPRVDEAIPHRRQQLFARLPLAQKLARARIYAQREVVVLGFVVNPELTARARRLALSHLARQVPDKDLRRRLTPDYQLGCKRVLISNDWYPALTQPNVSLQTDGIAEVRERSIVTGAGAEIAVDTIIFATGFHSADVPIARHLRFASGERLSERWAEAGAEAYKGTTVPGMPNLFFITGPNTVLGHSSMVFMMEAQYAYILSALDHLERNRLASVEVRAPVVRAWNDDLQRRLSTTVWNSGGCASWYLDAHGRNTSSWPGFTWQFARETRRFDATSYRVRRQVASNPSGMSADTMRVAGPT